MLKCLDASGFGPTLMRWVETFYNGITSCVLTMVLVLHILNYREE